MRWNKVTPPEKGTKRTRSEFAWLPRLCTGGVTAWLERVQVYEMYCTYELPRTRRHKGTFLKRRTGWKHVAYSTFDRVD